MGWSEWSETGLTTDKQKEIEQQVRIAVLKVGMPITALEWKYQESLGHWQLRLTTEWVMQKNRSDVNRALQDALQTANIGEPMNGIVLD